MPPGLSVDGCASAPAPAPKAFVLGASDGPLVVAALPLAGLDRQGSRPALDESWRSNLRGDATLLGPRAPSWYTGLQPAQCPGVQPDGRLTSLPLPVRGACGAPQREPPRAVLPARAAAAAAARCGARAGGVRVDTPDARRQERASARAARVGGAALPSA
jgi:hypothetical protein